MQYQSTKGMDDSERSNSAYWSIGFIQFNYRSLVLYDCVYMGLSTVKLLCKFSCPKCRVFLCLFDKLILLLKCQFVTFGHHINKQRWRKSSQTEGSAQKLHKLLSHVVPTRAESLTWSLHMRVPLWRVRWPQTQRLTRFVRLSEAYMPMIGSLPLGKHCN